MLPKFSAIPSLGGATGQTVGGCDWTGFSAESGALAGFHQNSNYAQTIDINSIVLICWLKGVRDGQEL